MRTGGVSTASARWRLGCVRSAYSRSRKASSCAVSHLKGRVCLQCGEPTDGRAQLCPAHKAASLAAKLAKERRRRKKGRARDKANGICTRNGCHDSAAPGKTYCDADLLVQRSYAKAHIERRRAAGLCLYTGCPELAVHGMSKCEAHREEMRRSVSLADRA